MLFHPRVAPDLIGEAAFGVGISEDTQVMSWALMMTTNELNKPITVQLSN